MFFHRLTPYDSFKNFIDIESLFSNQSRNFIFYQVKR